MNRNHIAALLTMNAGLLFVVQVQAGTWQNNAPFGATLQADLYTPTTPAASPAVLVAIHYCTGNKAGAHSWFESLADKHGFYVIAPDAGKQCFDSSATRDGDKAAIVKMVQYVITNKSVDKSRVFAAGFSSGGCMTNTLLAIYPDVFAGGAAMPGFPAGGWPAGDTSCTKCGASPPSTDGKYWGDIARKAFTWSGTYPCSQQWVGGADEYNFQGWLPAAAAQFQNLSNLSSGTSDSSAPSGWSRTVYKDTSGNVRLETNVKSGQKHDLTGSGLAGYVVTFLGLDKPTGACGVAGTSPADGGAGATGGASGSGGNSGTGGNTGAKDGGVGGSKDSGSDGVAGSGGTTSPGGAIGGGGGSPSSGGVVGKGGATGAGGSSGSGGSAGSGAGGTSSSGGIPASGGTSSSGGTTASGGSSGSGGSAGSGGTSSAGGSSGTGGSSTGGSSDPGGCGCTVGGTTGPGSGLALFLLAAVGLVLRRRRKTLG